MANNSSFFPSVSNRSKQNDSISNSLETRVLLGIDITIFVVAVLGNFLVLVVIYNTRERRKTPFEILITNLSVADILSVLLYFLYYNIGIPLSNWYCKLQLGFFSSIPMVSVLLMTTIAIFRCRSIVHPFITKPSTKLTCCTVLGLLILSNICFIPVYIVTEEQFGRCKEMWPSHQLNKVYTVSLAVLQYVIPLTIMAVCYTRIVVYLKQNRGPQCGLNPDRINQVKMARKRDMEVIKISLVIVLLFVIFTLPVHIASIALLFSKAITRWNREPSSILKYTHQIFLLHCCCNPFVYGTISREFRSRISRVLWATFCYTYKIERTRAGGLETIQRQGRIAAENVEMNEIKAYVKRDEGAHRNEH